MSRILSRPLSALALSAAVALTFTSSEARAIG